MNGRANLQRLTRALERGRPIPPEVAQWLAQGFERYEDGEDLAAALKLRTTRELIAERDQHLRAATKAMPPSWSASRRAVAARRAAGLVAAVESEDELEHLRRWEREIWHAIRAADLPGRRQLRRLLAME